MTAAFAAVGTPLLAAADDSIALASVARELGFAYTYLPYENAVSLYRPGATIVVRPGDAFFSANERREPVYGVVPFYRHNDVYVSRAFVDEIRDLGRTVGSIAIVGTTPAEAPEIAEPGVGRHAAAPAIALGRVESLVASYDATSDTIAVRGRATPGSRVALAVKATLGKEIPIVTVDRAVATTSVDGRFTATMTSGSDHFAPSLYTVEAAGVRDAAPIVATVTTPRP